MKLFCISFMMFFGLCCNAQNQEIESTIKQFFIGFHAKDTVKLKEVCHKKMLLQTISEGKKGTKLEEEKASDFIKSFATFPKDIQFEEKILSYHIQVDGTMAHAWTPYEFYINGNLSHSGVNSFTLYLKNNQWKIVHIVDTRRKK